MSAEERATLKTRRLQRAQRFMQTLQQELPHVHDQASAMQAARRIRQENQDLFYFRDYTIFILCKMTCNTTGKACANTFAALLTPTTSAP